jgi:hypothetical protein
MNIRAVLPSCGAGWKQQIFLQRFITTSQTVRCHVCVFCCVVGGGWMKAYIALVDWYRQSLIEVVGENPIPPGPSFDWCRSSKVRDRRLGTWYTRHSGYRLLLLRWVRLFWTRFHVTKCAVELVYGGCLGHSHMGGKWGACRVLVGKAQGRRPLGRPRRR